MTDFFDIVKTIPIPKKTTYSYHNGWKASMLTGWAGCEYFENVPIYVPEKRIVDFVRWAAKHTLHEEWICFYCNPIDIRVLVHPVQFDNWTSNLPRLLEYETGRIFAGWLVEHINEHKSVYTSWANEDELRMAMQEGQEDPKPIRLMSALENQDKCSEAPWLLGWKSFKTLRGLYFLTNA